MKYKSKVEEFVVMFRVNKVLFFSVLFLFLMFSESVQAIKNIPANKELTDVEYYNLKSMGLDDILIENLNLDNFNEYKNYTITNQVIVTKYYKEISFFSSFDHQYLYSNNIEITKEEYELGESYRGSIHETNYKRLQITLSTLSQDDRRVVYTTLQWKKIPSTKSHDVFAIYATSGKLLNNQTATQTMTESAPSSNADCRLINTIQHVTNYPAESGDWNIMPDNPLLPLLGSKGEGVSMKLNTNVSFCNYDVGMVLGEIKGYNFSLFAAAIPTNGANSVTIRASYQHAQSSVSLSDSKVYTYSTSGYGGVINFTNSVTASKYDQMGGVSATL